MYSFKNDYSEIAHPNILNLLLEYSKEQYNGYGLDKRTEYAKTLIKNHIESDVDIHFMVGGTIANKTVLSHILAPYEAVISADSGHINVHETGAIEATGHKVLLVPAPDGKLTVEKVSQVINSHTDEHMVKPKVIYISNATEKGTIYYKHELEALYQYAHNNGLYVFLDGARLGVALTATNSDLTLNDIATNTDIFYIGGTKNGAMLGEAVIIVNDVLKNNFRYNIKQNGGLLAKGFVAAIQFEGLFKDNLFFDLARHANLMANKIEKGLISLGLKPLFNANTNQQFVLLPNAVINKLKENYAFEIWDNQGDNSIIRLVTSWATKESEIKIFLNELKALI